MAPIIGLTSAITMTTVPGMPEYGKLAFICLMILMAVKELLILFRERPPDTSLDISIFPLILVVASILIFKVAEVISSM